MEVGHVSDQIPAAFAALPDDVIRAALASRWSAAPSTLDRELVRHLAECDDCSNDVRWYLDIREELEVTAYPCIHLAYGASSAANHLIVQQHGVYVLGGIVIGYCPWCGLELKFLARERRRLAG